MMTSDFLVKHASFVNVIFKRNSSLNKVLILIQNSKLLFMDQVVVKMPHYFLVVFNAVLKLDRNGILLRKLLERVHSL